MTTLFCQYTEIEIESIVQKVLSINSSPYYAAEITIKDENFVSAEDEIVLRFNKNILYILIYNPQTYMYERAPFRRQMLTFSFQRHAIKLTPTSKYTFLVRMLTNPSDTDLKINMLIEKRNSMSLATSTLSGYTTGKDGPKGFDGMAFMDFKESTKTYAVPSTISGTILPLGVLPNEDSWYIPNTKAAFKRVGFLHSLTETIKTNNTVVVGFDPDSQVDKKSNVIQLCMFAIESDIPLIPENASIVMSMSEQFQDGGKIYQCFYFYADQTDVKYHVSDYTITNIPTLFTFNVGKSSGSLTIGVSALHVFTTATYRYNRNFFPFSVVVGEFDKLLTYIQ